VSAAGLLVRPFGDEAVLLTLGDRVDPDLNRLVHRIATALTREREGGLPLRVPVPAYASVLVPFDLARIGSDEVRSLVAKVAEAALGQTPGVETGPIGRLVEIPTRYGGADGEDLEGIAARLGMTPSTVVELHASTEYEVFMLGFAPGFAYLGVLPEAIAVPRLPAPRPRVPPGSVAIAERQTAVYPSATPGGWNLIGRTEIALWDVERRPPALLAPGDRVRFVPIGRSASP
jgi:KipI family sensor histidine kinase inhibitor